MPAKLIPFDAAEYLDTPKSQAELLSSAFANGDPAAIDHALGIVARARQLSDTAEQAGVTHRSDFTIGAEFTCGGKTYRVTDVGTRVVVAIRVDAAEMTTKFEDGRRETNPLTRAEAEALGWFDGPPYGVPEQVFDEDDLEVCELA